MSQLEVLRFALFGEDVRQGVSTRDGGVSAAPYASLNLGVHVGDATEAVAENRRRFLTRLDLRAEQTAALDQVHSDTVIVVEEKDRGMGLVDGHPMVKADAMLTRVPDLALLIQSADCTLLLLHDPVQRAIGVVHAGWRGSVAGIAPKAVREMTSAFGSDPQDVRVGIAPAVGPCCYEVDEPVLGPVRRAYPQWYDEVVQPGRAGHGHLDLQELNRLQVVDAGVAEEHVAVLRLCTSCHRDLFFSERAEGAPTGRFGAVIALMDDEPLPFGNSHIIQQR